ncbi:hypothetical protein L1987_43841 [Smallanthus sonchifolius]|uniref:Uncharacterized protein n=1 Tax=Smallanthus sonchifolius TaxID=185202 RepID=A0ACB9GNZ8_9ASTR|nr:hypothetical protein L1987_43841 [Smallanthus sonchifolius]
MISLLSKRNSNRISLMLYRDEKKFQLHYTLGVPFDVQVLRAFKENMKVQLGDFSTSSEAMAMSLDFGDGIAGGEDEEKKPCLPMISCLESVIADCRKQE